MISDAKKLQKMKKGSKIQAGPAQSLPIYSKAAA